jgi:hypothetical protein
MSSEPNMNDFCLGGAAKRKGPLIDRPPKEYTKKELDAFSEGYVQLIKIEWGLLRKDDTIKYIITNKNKPICARVTSASFIRDGKRFIRVKSAFGLKPITWTLSFDQLQYIFVRPTAAEAALIRTA